MIIHDNGTEREMTESEIAELQEAQKLVAKDRKATSDVLAARATAREVLLTKLGITDEEARMLLS